jgi:hypothetical protein
MASIGGRNASVRDWSMGETILITVGDPTTAHGITVYPGVVYLCPLASGGWSLLDCDLPDPAETYEDLDSAARGAHQYVARKESSSGREPSPSE